MTSRRLTADLRMYRHSGIGRYLRNLFPLLLPRLHADHIRVLSRRELVADAPWLNDPRIEFVEAQAPIYTLGEQVLALRGAYRGSNLLWIPHYNAPLLYAGRTVLTMHDIAPLVIPEILAHAAKRVYARLLIQRAAKHAAAILCVSQFTAHELQHRLLIPAGKLTVTYPGLDTTWPQQAAPHVESDGSPYLLYVGNVKPNKNLKLLLQAFAEVKDRLPHRLVLAGKMRGFGTSDEAVVGQALALGDRVRFNEEIPDGELMRLYAGASALVLPSLYEGFGFPLLEAMRFGCPVLSSTAGSLPEVAGAAALYFDPHDQAQLAGRLLQVTQSPLMESLQRAGYERVRHFSFEQCAEQSAAVMNRLLERER